MTKDNIATETVVAPPGGNSLSVEQQLAENELRQIHDYTRHSFQMLVAWFTVFSTINYVAFGWMVAVSNGSSATASAGVGAAFSLSPLALPVALVFTLQNFLAFFAAENAAKILRSLNAKARDLQKGDGIIPINQYVSLVGLIQHGVVATGGLWFCVLTVAGIELWWHWPPPWLQAVKTIWLYVSTPRP